MTTALLYQSKMSPPIVEKGHCRFRNHVQHKEVKKKQKNGLQVVAQSLPLVFLRPLTCSLAFLYSVSHLAWQSFQTRRTLKDLKKDISR